MSFLLKSVAAAVLGVALASSAHAQSPQRPFANQTITVIEPFGQGSVTEVTMRALIPALEKELGAKIELKTVPSPEGTQAFDQVAAAKPDGRTLLAITDAARLFYEFLGSTRITMDRMTPIAKLTDGISLTLATSAGSPVRDYAALIAALKANRAPSLALYGNASPSGVLAAMIEDNAGGRFGKRIFDVDFRIDDDLRGRKADFGVLPSPALFRPSGKPNELRALLTSGARRHPKLPDVPTLAEVTGKPRLSFTAAVALVGPPNISIELAEALTRAVVAAGKDPEAKAVAERSSMPLAVNNNIVLRESMSRVKRVIKELLNP